MKTTRTILAIDPGKVNMAFCLVRQTGKKYRILKLGMVKHTIQDLKGLNLKSVVLKFHKEIDVLIKKYNVTELTMERFVSRGLMGSLSEFICIMQGILAIHPRIKVFNLVTAATWKNSFNKSFDLKEFYKMAHKLKILPHEVDATMIGLYYLDKTRYFERLKKKINREKTLARLARR